MSASAKDRTAIISHEVCIVARCIDLEPAVCRLAGGKRDGATFVSYRCVKTPCVSPVPLPLQTTTSFSPFHVTSLISWNSTWCC